MAPIRTYTNWNKRASDEEEQREPFRKYFFICEGANTEVWYFRKLIDIRKELGIHPLIDIRLMEKTEEDANISNPIRLIEFAEAQKEAADNEFDRDHDKMIVVFDADIYKNKPDLFKKIYDLGHENNILAVTNPSFELFLLLHYEKAYEEVILPNYEEILQNKRNGKRRYITILFTERSGMNPKENPGIGTLAEKIYTAIEQEKNINQDGENAIGNLTSNIGKIIQDIISDTL